MAFEYVYPLRYANGQCVPFPTIYWLTDPRLDRCLADLERRGWVGEVERVIGADGDLRQRLHQTHQRYADQRWARLTIEDRRAVGAAGLESTFGKRGVGGVANFDSIKCLHAHYAHHLADHNIVGQLLERWNLIPGSNHD